MHYAIVGAGSVGSFVGAHMVRTGHKVTFIDQWVAHVDAMKRQGLHLEGTSGELNIAVNALHIHEVQSLVKDQIDVALICVKSYDTAWATMLIKDYLSPTGFVVSVQNSFNEELMARIVGWGRVVGCVLNTIGVEVREPGKVVRWYEGSPDYAVFRVGEMHGRVTPRCQQVVSALSNAEVAAVTTNLWGERWSKLTINSLGSAIGAVTGMGLAEMYRNARTRRLVMRLGQEAISVGFALGFSLEAICGVSPEVWQRSQHDAGAESELFYALEHWADRIRSDGQASTLHDFRRGRRMEAESINGLVVQRGRSVGVATPYQELMVDLVRKLVAGDIEQGMASLEAVLAQSDAVALLSETEAPEANARL
jgi:2-dehydropantoate 2-reductase